MQGHPDPKNQPPQSPPDAETAVFAAIGEQGFHDLVHAFYNHVRHDDLLGPLYPDHDWHGAEQRLRDFLVFRFGGPPRYIEQRGHPRLRKRHFPFQITSAERDRWLELMEHALDEAAIPEPHATTLRRFFIPTADFMRNTPDASP